MVSRVVGIDIQMPDRTKFVRRIRLNSRRGLTVANMDRLGRAIEVELRSPRSRWPSKGGGVRGQATGRSKKAFRVFSPDGRKLLVTNRARSSGKPYTQYPEAGYPNRKTEGRARKTIKANWPRIVKRARIPGVTYYK